MKHSYVPINKELIPYSFEIVLGNTVFEIGVNYNEHADLFTLSLHKDGMEICAGEPLIYGVPLWKDVYRAESYPMVDIIPFDESGQTEKVTFDNLDRVVFLIIDDGEQSVLSENEELVHSE